MRHCGSHDLRLVLVEQFVAYNIQRTLFYFASPQIVIEMYVETFLMVVYQEVATRVDLKTTDLPNRQHFIEIFHHPSSKNLVGAISIFLYLNSLIVFFFGERDILLPNFVTTWFPQRQMEVYLDRILLPAKSQSQSSYVSTTHFKTFKIHAKGPLLFHWDEECKGKILTSVHYSLC